MVTIGKREIASMIKMEHLIIQVLFNLCPVTVLTWYLLDGQNTARHGDLD